MTKQSQFCQFDRAVNPLQAFERILEELESVSSDGPDDYLPVRLALLAEAGRQFILDRLDNSGIELAAVCADDAAFENGYGM
jgi:hypothetical protein